MHVFGSGSGSGSSGRRDAKTDVVKAGRCLVRRLVLIESHRGLIVPLNIRIVDLRRHVSFRDVVCGLSPIDDVFYFRATT